MQLLGILIPALLNQVLENAVLCAVMEVVVSLPVFHRAIGGAGIAGVRQVHRYVQGDSSGRVPRFA